jgi:hypothetical protein
MNKRGLALSVSALCLSLLALPLASQVPDGTLSLGLAPSIQMPVGSSDYGLGASAGMYLQYDLGRSGGLFLRGALDYGYSPYTGNNSLSLVAATAGGGYAFAFSPRFGLNAFAGLGYDYGFKNGDPSSSGGSLFASGGLGIDLVVSPALGIGLGLSSKYYAGLVTTAGAYLAATYFLSGREARQAQIRSAQPVDVELLKGFKVAPPGKGLSIEGAQFDSVFPVFRKYYDDHPVGRLRIRNNEKTAISGATVSLFIKEYMDMPKSTEVPPIGPGASVDVPVYGLFNDGILQVTEATKAAAELTADYRMDETPYKAQRAESMRILDRNAMTWDDDRRAAAFVTAKDPAILAFAKNASGYLRDLGVLGLDEHLSLAVVLHEALAQAGISYIVDPASSYAEQSKLKGSPDFLQFPRQTLSYKGGDCDDLSILNCALLESIGVETAFITVPGHIFMAFSLKMGADEARKAFSSSADLILRGGSAWVPVEITSISKGFFLAWKEGAREWRENEATGQAAFYPVREAWGTFEAVGLPGVAPELAPPPRERTIAAFSREVGAYIDGEIKAQLAKIDQQVSGGLGEREARNRRGIVYARFGRFGAAVEEFKKSLAGGDFGPALVNLGNIAFLSKDWKAARGYYERAAKADPRNPRIMLAVARSAYELDDAKTAGSLFAQASALDPSVGAKFAYLGGQSGSDTLRAADVEATKSLVTWEGQ